MKNTLYIFTLILTSVLLGGSLLAQPGGRGEKDDKSRIEAMKIAFITNKLDLSPAEAREFWPVYNQFQSEMEAMRTKRRANRQELGEDFGNKSDKEVEKMVDAEITQRQAELDLLKKYHTQFKKVLPIKKLAMLYKTEEDFKRELLKRIQDKRGGPGMRHED